MRPCPTNRGITPEYGAPVPHWSFSAGQLQTKPPAASVTFSVLTVQGSLAGTQCSFPGKGTPWPSASPVRRDRDPIAAAQGAAKRPAQAPRVPSWPSSFRRGIWACLLGNPRNGCFPLSFPSKPSNKSPQKRHTRLSPVGGTSQNG